MLKAGTTHVEGCVISGFDTGLLYEVGAGSSLIVADTVLRDNYTGINAIGFGAKGGLTVVRSRIHRNYWGIVLQDVDRASLADSSLASNLIGIQAITTAAATAFTSLSIQRTEIVQHIGGGAIAEALNDVPNKPFVNIANSTVSAGNLVGISAGIGGFVRVAGTQITGNLLGIYEFSIRQHCHSWH